MPDTFSIFVSSPGDVFREREIAMRVIKRLSAEFSGRIAIERYFWEWEPMDNSATFQDQIPPPDRFDLVLCIVWSRLGTQLIDGQGRKWNSGTEYEVAMARKSPHTKVWVFINQTPAQIRQLPAEERERMFEQLRQLEAFISRYCYDPATKSVHGSYTHYRDLGTFEERLEAHLRKMIADSGKLASPGRIAREPTWTDGSPFRRLETFERRHAAVFCGRQQAVSDVILALSQRALAFEEWQARCSNGVPEEDLEANPPAVCVLVSGMSGIGKSSLVRAGVLPLLTQPGDGVGLWRSAVFRAGSAATPASSAGSARIFVAFTGALLEAGAIPEILRPGWTAERLAQVLRSEPLAAGQMIAQALNSLSLLDADRRCGRLRQMAASFQSEGREADAKRCLEEAENTRPNQARLALVLDQLEELFTLEDVTHELRTKFVAAVAAMARCGAVTVIATMRSDFFHRCADLPVLVEITQGIGHYHLEQPRAFELAQIIQRPALAAGASFEGAIEGASGVPSLDDRILDEAQAHPEALPLLEFCLDELWHRRQPDGILTHRAFQEIGGLTGGIGLAAERSVAKAVGGDPESMEAKRAFHVLFQAVTTVDPEVPAVFGRRWARRSVVDKDSLAGAILDALLAPDCRLFLADVSMEGEPVVTMTHEALLTRWSRLAEWSKTHREMLGLRDWVMMAARDWQAEASKPDGKPDDLLLASGLPLSRGRQALEAGFVDDVWKPFVLASIEREQAQERGRALAEESAHRRKRRILGGLLVAAVTVAAGLAVLWRRSEDATAVARQRTGEVEKLLAEAEIERAERLFEEAKGPAAVEALQRAVRTGAAPRAAHDRLWFALTQRPWPHPVGTARNVGARPMAVSFDRTGTRFAVATQSGTVHVGRTDEDGELMTLPHPRGVRCAQFAPDGRRMATGCQDGVVRVWDIEVNPPVTLGAGRHDDEVLALCWSADGKLLVTGSRDKTCRVRAADKPEDPLYSFEMPDSVHTVDVSQTSSPRILAVARNSVKVWDAGTGTPLSEYIAMADLGGASFSSDGSHVAGFGSDGALFINDSMTGELHWQGHLGERCQDAALSADGSFLVTASGTTMAVHPIRSPEEAGWSVDLGRLVTRVRLSEDGGRILSTTDDGRIELWDARRGQPLSEPIIEAGTLLAADFNASTHQVVTARAGGEVRVRRFRLPAKPPAACVTQIDDIVALDTRDSVMMLVGRDGRQLEITPLGEWRAMAPVNLASSEEVVSAVMSPGGDDLLLGLNSGRLLKSRPNGESSTIHEFVGAVTQLKFSPRGGWLNAGTEEGEVSTWAWPGCEPRGETISHGRKVTGLVPVAESGQVLSFGADRKIRRSGPAGNGLPRKGAHDANGVAGELPGDPLLVSVDAARGSLFVVLDGGITMQSTLADLSFANALPTNRPVAAMAMSHHSNRVAVSTLDGSLLVWDLAERVTVSECSTGSTGVLCVAFSGDDEWIAGGDTEGRVRVWSATRLKAVTEPLELGKPVHFIKFLGDSRFLGAASEDGVGKVWDLSVPADVLRDAEGAGLFAPFEREGRRRKSASDGILDSWRRYHRSLTEQKSPMAEQEASRLAPYVQ